MKRHILALTAALLGSFLLVTGAAAAGDILTVHDARSDRSVTFTDADLLALPQVSFETETIWTEGGVTFSGPSLKSVLEHAEMVFSNVELYAINDYNVVLPPEKIEDGAPIIANRINGEPFSVRDKGPLWVVFPYDDVSKYNTEEYFSLSVWQLNRLNVLTE